MYRRGQFMQLSRNLSEEKKESHGMSPPDNRVGAQDLQNKIDGWSPLKTFRKKLPLTYR